MPNKSRGTPTVAAAVLRIAEGRARIAAAQQRFSKEAYYKAAKMRSRLAASDEGSEWYRGDEIEMPSYLRRKLEQGKRFDPTKKDSDRSSAK
jgi:hypothetical protein